MDWIPALHNMTLWEQIRRQPMARMLLLSLSLHVAVVMLVQPRGYVAHQVVTVINAQLTTAPPASPPPAPAAVPVKPAVQPLAEPAALEPVRPEPSVPARQDNAKPAPVLDARPAVTAPEAKTAVVRPAASDSLALPSVPVLVDTNWYEARQLDVQPRASQPINPIYPVEALRRNQQGTVKLKLKVDEFGVVRDVEVQESEPPAVFENSSLDAFKHGHFEPARKDGRPVRALIYIRVRYELDND